MNQTENSDQTARENSRRLSDRVISALELAVEQRDRQVADLLVQAMDMAMTRNAGGADFQERREFSDRLNKVLADYRELCEQNKRSQ